MNDSYPRLAKDNDMDGLEEREASLRTTWCCGERKPRIVQHNQRTRPGRPAPQHTTSGSSCHQAGYSSTSPPTQCVSCHLTQNESDTRLGDDGHLKEALHPRLHEDRKGDDGVIEDVVHGREAFSTCGCWTSRGFAGIKRFTKSEIYLLRACLGLPASRRPRARSMS